jgi:hypothetical protein
MSQTLMKGWARFRQHREDGKRGLLSFPLLPGNSPTQRAQAMVRHD